MYPALPNHLTWARIIAIPIFIGIFYLPDAWIDAQQKNLLSTVLFVGAALTDLLDGYIARRYQLTTPFGAFLDPVADKLIVAAALILLVELDRVGAVIAVIIIGREITISALREWMAKVGSSGSVAVSMIGKVKTAAQMTAIPMLLFHAPLFGIDVHRVGTWLIYLAAVLTLWSMVYYLRRAQPAAAKPGAG
ncbi:MAG: CDP-diacylglycerol--glycerol-3-phosphate 3-phosphatidyltransferase [bacterium]|jgi:CDP-diacylglycerol--glycerol-3-phosphate 3-phosphatidyltransferase|nr:CDP-diacylglycerol--glycerol-3-phosphate 3-phosphatidyltransferase [Betaproteobacteria bacterium]